jgi:hypothetical protein
VDDIAECRVGIATGLLRTKFGAEFFGTTKEVEETSARVFSLVGSECTIDMEAPSAMARDALVIRFQLWIQKHIDGMGADAQSECWAPSS